jgi:cyanophycinase
MKAAQKFTTAFIVVLLLTGCLALATASEVGPAKGTLMIVGGGIRDIGILARFVELAGGPDAPIVVVPTAGGAKEYDQYWSGLEKFRAAGARNLTVLHTVDRDVANSEKFVEPLRKARGVFFWEGRQWHIADSYLNTLTQREFQAVLDRGGVIGGSSAGASIQGSFLIRGDTKTSDVIMGDHQVGLGFMRNVGIDQHVLVRNRIFDMISVIEAHPNLLGIGIDENTAIIVQQDQFEVIGHSYVAIYDNQKQLPPNGRFYFLSSGDRYNLATREASRPSQTTQPISVVKKVPWPKSEVRKNQ